ncbi:hypothetical protein M2352_000515 [Azospirillum fermentarium]|uniref:hypothetical protein n=1 Tax=Azospirillum fermentarium TaxID=1233114 RepID=UPI002227E29D|nr:hypothetical protein [Azospirillum fermentarium]MCW2244924.1 hypothetical protein [Azospirillum fermentarium]
MAAKKDEDDDNLTPEQAQLAIEKAAQKTPAVALFRDKLAKMLSDEQGQQLMVNAIRRMLHE